MLDQAPTLKNFANILNISQSLVNISTLQEYADEIETQIKSENLYNEKEILQPGDEGYVLPTEG